MAAAVGRGRSRGIRGTRQPSPAVSPAINSPALQTAPPPPLPINTTTKLAHDCMDALRGGTDEANQKCISYINSLPGSDVPAWLEACAVNLYGDRKLTQDFVQMLCVMQNDQTVTIKMEILRALLSLLQSDKDRLWPGAPGSSADENIFSGFVTLLAEVVINLRKTGGTPITPLAPPLLECISQISKPKLPDTVYEVIYHALIRYGGDFEQHLQAVAKDTTDVKAKVERLYDSFRGIVIDDATSDISRLRMLEVIERRAYGYSMPESCLQYYQSAG